MDYSKLELTMRALALAAGEKIMEIYHSDNFDIRAKSDDSPVTAADEAADALIFEGLRQAFPDTEIVTEEQADSHLHHHDRFLIVDPLDGTKEFIHRRGEFTVNIAYVENGRPTRGIVYAPAISRLFYTTETGKTVEELGPFDPNSQGERRNLSVSNPDNQALHIVASKSHRDEQTDLYLQKYSTKELKSAGSSLKFCLVATGEADIYPRLGRTMEWDTAAGHAVLLGAGGTVLRFDNHEELKYGKPGYENPFFIATSPGVDLK